MLYCTEHVISHAKLQVWPHPAALFSCSLASRYRYVFVIVSYLIGVFIFATIVGEYSS